ncbi:MAG: LptF/LptG family permease [Puniceicoccales bacterium]|nr:LptF/LptG family permease [Puniceicoccales bacterium]
MSLLDRYIFREWLKIFVMALISMVGLLLVGRVFGDMPDFARWGASERLVLKYFALQTPAYLPVVIPVALLVSVLFILGFFHRNHELTAMRAAGIGVGRITRGLWVAGAALSVMLFALNATLVPWATEEARRLFETAKFDFLAREDGRAGAAAAGTTQKADPDAVVQFYANPSAGRIWSINRFSGYTGRGYGIIVYQNDGEGRPIEGWMARYGWYDRQHGHWVLEDGRRLECRDGAPTAQPAFKRLALKQLTEEPQLMRALDKKPHHLSINEIRGVLKHAGAEKSARMAAYAVQYHYVLASPFCCLIVIGLAVPFAVSGVRVNPMVGVSKSLVLFALYYLLSNLCALLGARQNIPPALAAWAPNLAMLALAIWLCRRIN